MQKKALWKITSEDLEEILKTKDHGLWEEFLQDGWVYLVDERGRDLNEYHGFLEDSKIKVNEKIESPYAVCHIHTQEAWEAYLASQVPPTEPTVPGDPNNPNDPGNPGAPAIPGTPTSPTTGSGSSIG